VILKDILDPQVPCSSSLSHPSCKMVWPCTSISPPAVLKFELRASCLLGKCSTFSVILPGLMLLLRPALDLDPSTSTEIRGMCHHACPPFLFKS
jgi:hypothetical protein